MGHHRQRFTPRNTIRRRFTIFQWAPAQRILSQTLRLAVAATADRQQVWKRPGPAQQTAMPWPRSNASFCWPYTSTTPETPPRSPLCALLPVGPLRSLGTLGRRSGCQHLARHGHHGQSSRSQAARPPERLPLPIVNHLQQPQGSPLKLNLLSSDVMGQ